MPRLPSDATLLRQAKSDLKRWKGRWEATMTEYNLAMKRAVHAEQEAVEWRRRFDLLLVKAPALTGMGAEAAPQEDPRMAEVRSLMREYATKEAGTFGNSKVQAVKLYREITRASLRDSVIACEAMMNGSSPRSATPPP